MESYIEVFLKQLPEEAKAVATEYMVARRKLEGKVQRYYDTIGEDKIIKDPDDPLYEEREAPSDLLEHQQRQAESVVRGVEQQLRQEIGGVPNQEMADFGIPYPEGQEPVVQQPQEVDPAIQELEGAVDALSKNPALQADATISGGGDLSDIPLGFDDIAAAQQAMNGQTPTANMGKYMGGAALKYERASGAPQSSIPTATPANAPQPQGVI